MKPFKLRMWTKAGAMSYSDSWHNLSWQEIELASKEGRLMSASGLQTTQQEAIYEEDYVEVYNTYKEERFKAKMIFKNGQFALQTAELTTHSRWINYRMVLLGNAYETPGLLVADE